ncbi:MAG: cytochrome c3 family protein [Planctomycetota bacterium]
MCFSKPNWSSISWVCFTISLSTRGVSCVTCHGRIDTMEKVYQAKELSMAWCIECHNNPEEHIRPVELVTKLDWEPAEGEGTKAEIGRKLIEEKGIHPKANCAVCHR